MHCIIQTSAEGGFPRSLRPVKGRAVMDYLIEDALRQREITHISVVADQKTHSILSKHIKNAFPEKDIQVVSLPLNSIVRDGEDVMLLKGSVYSSLKLQDFIRYFRQFKTITKVAVNKVNPQGIPFVIVPGKYHDCLENLPQDAPFHTYNCGSGFLGL